VAGKFYSLLHSFQAGSGVHTAFYTTGRVEALSFEVKQLGREANHCPPSIAEVKKSGTLPPLLKCLHGMVLN
jgi:hypothetical protein